MLYIHYQHSVQGREVEVVDRCVACLTLNVQCVKLNQN